MISSSIKIPTKRYLELREGYDRDIGQGVGHLFKVDAKGNLVADVTLGEGSMYHPGGIDYDGRHIWVPVAEYRPNSRSIIYRVDPKTMAATEVLRFGDHIGGIVHNTLTRACTASAGLAALLQMDTRRRRQGHQRGCRAREAEGHEPRPLHRTIRTANMAGAAACSARA